MREVLFRRKCVRELVHKIFMLNEKGMQYYLSETYRQELGKLLKEIRVSCKFRKISQKQIADLLGVDRQHINRVENGKILANVPEIICYSRLFQVPVKNILFFDEYKLGYDDDIWDIDEFENFPM